MDQYNHKIHTSPFPALHNPTHPHIHMQGWILFNLPLLNNTRILNKWIPPTHPIQPTIIGGKERIGITTILVKAGIIPHNTNPLGATRTKGTKTPKGAITTDAKGGILLKPITLVLFVAYTAITLTIAPRSQISKDWKIRGIFPPLLHNLPHSRHNNNMCNNPLPPYYKILSHIRAW
jgi:hypothetical protein